MTDGPSDATALNASHTSWNVHGLSLSVINVLSLSETLKIKVIKTLKDETILTTLKDKAILLSLKDEAILTALKTGVI